MVVNIQISKARSQHKFMLRLHVAISCCVAIRCPYLGSDFPFMQLSGMVGDEESMPNSGVLKSPNYPERYPNDQTVAELRNVTDEVDISV